MAKTIARFTLIASMLAALAVSAYADTLSEPSYRLIEELDVMIPMRDGTRLSTNIYRPDAPGAFPVLMCRTPYGNGGTGYGPGRYYAERGYVVVVQDTRGRYESEGAFYPFRYEANDGRDLLKWITEKPWCNGKIGTFGGSYVGYTQWAPVLDGASEISCMVPLVTFSDLYGMQYKNGGFRLRLISDWGFQVTASPDYDCDVLDRTLDLIDSHLPLIDHDRLIGWRVPFFRDAIAHPTRDRYWHMTDYRGNFDTVDAAILNIGGWFDLFTESTIDNFVAMTGPDIPYAVKKRQRLIMGPWIHGISAKTVGEVDFGEDSRIDLNREQLRWFDTHLKGKDVDDTPPVRIFVMGRNEWRDENEWPPARTEYTPLYFTKGGDVNDGGLDYRESGDAVSHVSYVYDPSDPVPSGTTEEYYTPFTQGMTDQRPIEARDDVLVYTTPPLDEEVEVTGHAKVILYAASSSPDTDFTVKLCDVYPDGRSMRLCDTIMRARFRDGDDVPKNIIPGRVYRYEIKLPPTSNVFLKGHRIRVDVSSSNFPRFDRNLNTAEEPAHASAWIKAEQTVSHGGTEASHIILPVIPAE